MEAAGHSILVIEDANHFVSARAVRVGTFCADEVYVAVALGGPGPFSRCDELFVLKARRAQSWHGSWQTRVYMIAFSIQYNIDAATAISAKSFTILTSRQGFAEDQMRQMLAS
jgi:hypothetical protein